MSGFLNYWIPPSIAGAHAETRRRAQLLVRCVVVMMAIYPVMLVIYTLRGHGILSLIVGITGILQPLPLVVLKYGKSLS
jgi:hypothetical protein